MNERRDKVLVKHGRNGMSFPGFKSAEVPHHGTRMSECISYALFQECGSEYKFALLYSTETEPYQNQVRHPHRALFVVCGPYDEQRCPVKPASSLFDWAPVSAFRRDGRGLAETEDKLARDTLFRDPVNPWERPRWFSTIKIQALAVLQQLEVETKDTTFLHHNVTTFSTLIEIKAKRESFYLKCGNQIEAAVTEVAASIAPSLVRTPLHICKKNGWMIMRDYGTAMKHHLTGREFAHVAPKYSALQLRSVSYLKELEEIGLVKQSAASLSKRLKIILEEVRADSGSGALTKQRAVAVVERFLNYVYEESGLPLVLQHGDINNMNVLRTSNGRHVIINGEGASIDLPLADVSNMTYNAKAAPDSAKNASIIERGEENCLLLWSLWRY